MKTVVISGTPGTGKTTVSEKISEKINAKVISLNDFSISEKITCGYDVKRDTYIIDIDKLIPRIKNLIEQYRKKKYETLILESHFADIVPKEFIDYAIVLRCDPEELSLRLKKKGYNEQKVKENIQTEFLNNCANYFIQKQIDAPILEIDTTNLSVENMANIIIEIIVFKKNLEKYRIGKIDWLKKLVAEDSLARKYFY